MEFGAPSPDEIRQHIEKILASPEFRRSERMRRFLQFTADQVIEGRGGEIKEYLVGMQVFDRGSDFDPAKDSIVRVEARRLRDKLKAYYRTQGQYDPLVIHFDPGTYAPVFRKWSPNKGRPVTAALLNGGARPDGVAVLPFTNSGGAPEDEYLADGLSEEIINALAQAA